MIEPDELDKDKHDNLIEPGDEVDTMTGPGSPGSGPVYGPFRPVRVKEMIGSIRHY